MNKNPTKRQKTRAKLLEAFFQEYRQHPLREITVGAVAAGAKVNRSTFYEYFEDIYDLMEQAQKELLSTIRSSADQLRNTAEGRAVLLTALGGSIMEEHGQQLGLLLSRGDSGFQKRLLDTMRPAMVELLGMNCDDPQTQLVIAFLLSGITGYIAALYEAEPTMDRQEAARTLQTLMAASLRQSNILPEKPVGIF